jgi:hypothetical protein
MKSILHRIAGVGLIAFAALSSQASSPTVPSRQQPCLHTRTSFDLLVHASYAVTAPLFGPNGERSWAGEDWNPEFIYPRQPSEGQPASDEEGAVFTVRHGPFSAVWVTTAFDVVARHYQYVYFQPDLMVAVIDVRFQPMSAVSTAVDVVFTRTALTLQGNKHVTAMSEIDKTAGKDWPKALDDYLARSVPATKTNSK